VNYVEIIGKLDEAYSWLCKQREKASPNADIWYLRFNWDKERADIVNNLKTSSYRFDSTKVFDIDGEYIEQWAAKDAVVLKALALTLTQNWKKKKYFLLSLYG